jgi:hypothetical protein
LYYFFNIGICHENLTKRGLLLPFLSENPDLGKGKGSRSEITTKTNTQELLQIIQGVSKRLQTKKMSERVQRDGSIFLVYEACKLPFKTGAEKGECFQSIITSFPLVDSGI